jgi:mono/diheme cytochrome c family protein
MEIARRGALARGVPPSSTEGERALGALGPSPTCHSISGEGMRKTLWCWAAAAACAVATPQVARAQAGADIFRVRCVMCHGPQGRGNGPMAASLNPRPIDFADAAKRLATTDSAVGDVIRRGRRSMPAFGSMLSRAQVDSLVAFLKTLHH